MEATKMLIGVARGAAQNSMEYIRDGPEVTKSKKVYAVV